MQFFIYFYDILREICLLSFWICGWNIKHYHTQQFVQFHLCYIPYSRAGLLHCKCVLQNKLHWCRANIKFEIAYKPACAYMIFFSVFFNADWFTVMFIEIGNSHVNSFCSTGLSILMLLLKYRCSFIKICLKYISSISW